jgi:hypothetical protein
MGAIREVGSGQQTILHAEHSVGRAPGSMLQLLDGYVSGQHAVVHWTGASWGVTDLRSRNGTYVDGRRLDPLDEHALRCGAIVAFGRAREQQWTLVDSSPPEPMIVPLEGGESVRLVAGLAPLASQEDPSATVFRDLDGCWILERAGELTTAIADGDVFRAAGRPWRLCAAAHRLRGRVPGFAGPAVSALSLALSVDDDGRQGGLQVLHDDLSMGGSTPIRSRFLMALACCRLADRDSGVAEGACGWRYEEDLSNAARLAADQLDREIFRIRKEFARFGVVDAGNIVERWPRTRQLRVGTGQITIRHTRSDYAE